MRFVNRSGRSFLLSEAHFRCALASNGNKVRGVTLSKCSERGGEELGPGARLCGDRRSTLVGGKSGIGQTILPGRAAKGPLDVKSREECTLLPLIHHNHEGGITARCLRAASCPRNVLLQLMADKPENTSHVEALKSTSIIGGSPGITILIGEQIAFWLKFSPGSLLFRR